MADGSGLFEKVELLFAGLAGIGLAANGWRASMKKGGAGEGEGGRQPVTAEVAASLLDSRSGAALVASLDRLEGIMRQDAVDRRMEASDTRHCLAELREALDRNTASNKLDLPSGLVRKLQQE